MEEYVKEFLVKKSNGPKKAASKKLKSSTRAIRDDSVKLCTSLKSVFEELEDDAQTELSDILDEAFARIKDLRRRIRQVIEEDSEKTQEVDEEGRDVEHRENGIDTDTSLVVGVDPQNSSEDASDVTEEVEDVSEPITNNIQGSAVSIDNDVAVAESRVNGTNSPNVEKDNLEEVLAGSTKPKRTNDIKDATIEEAVGELDAKVFKGKKLKSKQKRSGKENSVEEAVAEVDSKAFVGEEKKAKKKSKKAKPAVQEVSEDFRLVVSRDSTPLDPEDIDEHLLDSDKESDPKDLEKSRESVVPEVEDQKCDSDLESALESGKKAQKEVIVESILESEETQGPSTEEIESDKAEEIADTDSVDTAVKSSGDRLLSDSESDILVRNSDHDTPGKGSSSGKSEAEGSTADLVTKSVIKIRSDLFSSVTASQELVAEPSGEGASNAKKPSEAVNSSVADSCEKVLSASGKGDSESESEKTVRSERKKRSNRKELSEDDEEVRKEKLKNRKDRRALLGSSDESDYEIVLPIKRTNRKELIPLEELQEKLDKGTLTLPECQVRVKNLTKSEIKKLAKSISRLRAVKEEQEEEDEAFSRAVKRLNKSSPCQKLSRRLSNKKRPSRRLRMSDDSDVVAISSDEEVVPNGNSKEEHTEEELDQNMADRAALLLSSSEDEVDGEEEEEEEEAKKEKKGSSKSKKKQKPEIVSDDDDSDTVEKQKMKEKDVEKLLKASDSDSDFAKPKQKKKKEDSDPEANFDSDSSEVAVIKKRTKRKKKEESSDDSDESEKQEKKPKKRLKRVKTADESTDDEVEMLESKKDAKGRKNIKKIIKDKHLQDETRQAAKEEEERRRRIAERQSLYNQVFEGPEAESNKKVSKVVLDFDPETKKELVTVHPQLCENLKPHQASGVKFMWDACYETVERAKKSEGSGCILAHCMGLGKTLQVVTLIHTLLTHDDCGTRTALVVCPVSTVLNWVNEFNIWLKDEMEVDVYELASAKQNTMRKMKLDAWFRTGGVMIMGYDAYRLYTNDVNKKIKGAYKQTFQKTLVDPGPDIVICDEGHLLKNESSALSKAMTKIRTKRRIVLTGTPLQNNLKEYHCMINFVKPNLLGTKKEFLNRFVNPIMNGQCADATERDVKIMKKRAHVLHSMMEGSVQRKDYGVLTPFLPPKQEYVLSVMLSEPQIKMYRYYLDNLSKGGVGRGRGLFADFQALARLWTHPQAMKIAKQRQDLRKEQEESEEELADFIDDRSDAEATDDDIQCLDDDKLAASGINWKTRTRAGRGNGAAEDEELEAIKEEDKHWWDEFVPEDDMAKMELSGKLVLLLAILRACELIGDKILVFSQSLITLDVIEEFLRIEDEKNELTSKDGSYFGSWKLGFDYFRLDGSMAADTRKTFCNRFNREDNLRARLFLISTKAGGLGINLVGANRVIIFDASWNPSYDIQSIFRVYRFGQKKPVYVYRFLAQGTMEEKIYQRQVAKQSLACRVVDEQQIERHFTTSDLQELYSFEPDVSTNRPTPKLPKDLLLAELLQSHKDLIVSYHEHDSLLESKEDENLTEEERKAAWEEYENEKKGLVSSLQQMPAQFDPYAAYGYQMPMNMAPVMPSFETLREYLKAQKPDMSNEELDARARIAVSEYVSLYRAMLQQQAIAERERMLALQQMMSLNPGFGRASSSSSLGGMPRGANAYEAGPSGARSSVKLPAKTSAPGPTRLTEISVPVSKVLANSNQSKLQKLLVAPQKNGDSSLPKLSKEVTLTPVEPEEKGDKE